MRKNSLTLFAVCATLLWAVAAVWAGPPQPPPAGTRFPATGQTTSYVAGDDGAIRAGSPLSYTDNGDGTITDNNTKLMWDKKDMSGGLHDVGNIYSWMGIFDWVAQLNTAPCFANHCDWRIPNVKELQSIVDYQNSRPAVDAAFNTSCSTGCAVTSCSCTQSGFYWSASTDVGHPGFAWFVDFFIGVVDSDGKAGGLYVRALRSGL